MNISTSSPLVAAIHDHHTELERKLTEYTGQFDAGIDQFDASWLTELLTQLSSLLTEELLPHAQGEEPTGVHLDWGNEGYTPAQGW